MQKISSDFDDSFSVVRLLKHSLELFCFNFDLRFKFTNTPLFLRSEADFLLNQTAIAPLKELAFNFSNDHLRRISELEEKGWFVTLFMFNFRECEESLTHNYTLALGVDPNLKECMVKDHLVAYPSPLLPVHREPLLKLTEDVKHGEYGFISNTLTVHIIENHQFEREHLIYGFVNESLVFAIQKRIEKRISFRKAAIEQAPNRKASVATERLSIRQSQRKSLGMSKSPVEIEGALKVELRQANEVFDGVVRALKMREFG